MCLRTLFAGLFTCLALSGCAVEGLAFEEDDRIEFSEPGYREQVTLPFTIRWRVSDFEITGPDGGSRPDAGYIQIMFDGQPQPPGEGLEYFARDDPACMRSDKCPNREYLAQRRIYTTTDTSFPVEALPPAPGVELERGDPDIHEVVLVFLDGRGRRIGESAWWTAFEILHEE